MIKCKKIVLGGERMFDIQAKYDFYKKILKDEEMICAILKGKLYQEIENDLKHNNPDKLLQKYRDRYKGKKFKTITIKKDTAFYRARIGKFSIPANKDDLNITLDIPFYGDSIKAAPPIYTPGGRFNRAGVSYLYLATDIETCLAEVHLQVGQECSVAQFKSNEDIKLVNLSDHGGDLELDMLYRILVDPVYDAIKHKYFITQFIAEVIKDDDTVGFYFKSAQSNGDNIVCFNPDKFDLVRFSEKLYVATGIRYEFGQVRDSIVLHAEMNDAHLLDLENYAHEDEKDKLRDYIYEWIKHKQREEKAAK